MGDSRSIWNAGIAGNAGVAGAAGGGTAGGASGGLAEVVGCGASGGDHVSAVRAAEPAPATAAKGPYGREESKSPASDRLITPLAVRSMTSNTSRPSSGSSTTARPESRVATTRAISANWNGLTRNASGRRLPRKSFWKLSAFITADIITMGTLEPSTLRFIISQTSVPRSFGSSMSRRTRSGFSALKTRMPSMPSLADSIVCPCAARKRSSIVRIWRSSSMMRIFAARIVASTSGTPASRMP